MVFEFSQHCVHSCLGVFSNGGHLSMAAVVLAMAFGFPRTSFGSASGLWKKNVPQVISVKRVDRERGRPRASKPLTPAPDCLDERHSNN